MVRGAQHAKLVDRPLAAVVLDEVVPELVVVLEGQRRVSTMRCLFFDWAAPLQWSAMAIRLGSRVVSLPVPPLCARWLSTSAVAFAVGKPRADGVAVTGQCQHAPRQATRGPRVCACVRVCVCACVRACVCGEQRCHHKSKLLGHAPCSQTSLNPRQPWQVAARALPAALTPRARVSRTPTVSKWTRQCARPSWPPTRPAW